MKKLLGFILFAAIIIWSPIVHAESGSLSIGTYNISAELLPSGDMQVKETIEYKFAGSLNGVKREIIFPKDSSVEDIHLSQDGHAYKLVNYASNGDKGVYRLDTQSNNSVVIWIYEPTTDRSKTINISYTIKNAAVKYQDTGEIYWKFIGSENKAPIKSLSIDLHLPEGAAKDNVKLFAHGPLTGVSQKVDNRTENISINNLPAERYVEARVLFPKELIPEAKRVNENNALNEILNQEASFAKQANEERIKAREKLTLSPAAEVIISIYCLLTILISIIIKMKYGRKITPEFKSKYLNDLPQDYSPAVMSALYYSGTIDSKNISATLMDLVRKGYLKLDTLTFDTFGADDFMITKLKEPDDQLLYHERFFIQWLFRDFGIGQSFTINTIRNNTKSLNDAKKFKDNFDKWKALVKKDAEYYNFFDSKKRIKGFIPLILFIILIVIVAIISFLNCSILTQILCFLAAIISLCSISINKKRTPFGENQYAKWKAFKNYLLDFSKINEMELPSLITWEQFLPYAITLGVAEKVIAQLKLVELNKIMSDDFDSYQYTYLYCYDEGFNYRMFDQVDNFSSSFDKITSSAFSVASSINSSSDGSGGGFSDGGSFGGGDGGGGSSGF